MLGRVTYQRDARAYIGVVYNLAFRLKFWSDKTMIRFLQTPGPTKKIILGGMLLVICAAMVITLVPGGIGDSIGLGGPGQGVVAKVAGRPPPPPAREPAAPREAVPPAAPRGAHHPIGVPHFPHPVSQP